MSEAKKKLPRYRGYSRLIKTGNSGSLSVPSEMMTVLTEGLLFKPELTKDGILFRVVDESKIAAEDKPLPAWVKAKPKPKAKATSPIPPVDDEHPDSDGSDEGETFDQDDDEPTENVEADDAEDEAPPSDDDSPF